MEIEIGDLPLSVGFIVSMGILLSLPTWQERLLEFQYEYEYVFLVYNNHVCHGRYDHILLCVDLRVLGSMRTEVFYRDCVIVSINPKIVTCYTNKES